MKSLIEKFELENSCSFEVSVFNDGNQFLGSSMQSFDIVYMDMLMPGLDGIEVSKMLRNISKNVQIIIVSSTPNFAIKGYLVDAVGYILKPVNYFIFKTTTEKAIENLKKEASAFIYINNKGEKLKVNLNDVLYDSLEDLYSNIGMLNGQFWVREEGSSGLAANEQIRIIEQMTGKPYHMETDAVEAAKQIKKSDAY